MTDHIRERINRKLDSLAEDRLYQVLDFVEYLESKYAARQNPAPNPLQQIRFGQFQNAKVTIGGQNVASGQVYTVPAGATSVDFTVERVTPGQPVMVPFTVVDGCGEWRTFVGGGNAAGF